MEINGGLRAGNNLFHSFEEFSVPEGMEAAFENALDIENIFARVTGDSGSNIKGTISAQGTANLFLMNSNGIVFSESASINVGGSFLATTTNSIQFEDGTEFASSATEDPTITPSDPNGFAFKEKAGAAPLTIEGTGNSIIAATLSPTQIEDSSQGLEVESGNTLAFIAKGIDVSGGTITAESGNIELGSVGSGTVDIQQTENGFTLDYGNISNYQNIDLSDRAVLNASGEKAGIISVTGNNVNLSNGSLALITNPGDSNSGDINFNVAETFTLSGTAPDGSSSSAIRSESFGSGKGANINISTRDIVIKNASIASAITNGDGLGGNVNVDATGSIELLENTGIDPARPTNAVGGFGSTTYGSGDAGNVRVSAERIKMIDGSIIGSPSVGVGDGGDITVQAGSIEVVGTNKSESAVSGVLAASASTGNAGNISIDTSQLSVIDGASINSASIAKGNAGNITINASEAIEVTGQSQSSTEPRSSNISSSVAIPSEAFQQAFGLDLEPRGQAGSVVVDAPLLAVNQNGEISVANKGTGNAGTLTINSEDVNLDNSGSITAESASGTGGNIELNANDLQIDSGSQITAKAGSEAEGGNITINTSNLKM